MLENSMLFEANVTKECQTTYATLSTVEAFVSKPKKIVQSGK